MKAKVLISFSGAIDGVCGEIIDITDKDIYNDLLRAQYIESLEEIDHEQAEEETPAPVEEAPKKRKKRV